MRSRHASFASQFSGMPETIRSSGVVLSRHFKGRLAAVRSLFEEVFMQRLRAICVGFSLLLTQAAMAQSAVVDEQVTVDFVRAYMQKHGGCAVFSPNWHAQFNLAAPVGKPLRDWTASDVRLFERYGLACIDREEARRPVPDPSWRQALQRQFRDRN